ncbi:MAG: hypothetical protein U0183_01230 [Polyangiaceae bacterium]
MRCGALGLALALVACAPESASPVEWPDGRGGYAVECERAADCVRDAREACGGPFVVVASHGRDELVTTHTEMAWGTVTSGSSRTRRVRIVTLTVRCR